MEHCHLNISYWTLHGLWWACLSLSNVSEFVMIRIVNKTWVLKHETFNKGRGGGGGGVTWTGTSDNVSVSCASSRPDKGIDCNPSWHFNSSEIQVFQSPRCLNVSLCSYFLTVRWCWFAVTTWQKNSFLFLQHHWTWVKKSQTEWINRFIWIWCR